MYHWVEMHSSFQSFLWNDMPRWCSISPVPLSFKLYLFIRVSVNGLGVLRTDGKVVYIRCNVLIMIVDTSHPDIWFSLAREEAHVLKTCGEAFTPA
jgi:hypothetical protein